jgi:hypothetical protein
VFADDMKNPVIEAASRLAAGAGAPVSPNTLYDQTSGLLHAAGPNYRTAGVTATFTRRLHGAEHLHFAYANGDALAMPLATHPGSLAQVFAAARPRRVQTYTLSLTGTLEGTGTTWRASYRWQPEDTVTPAAAFTIDQMPYLNLHLRQPICARHDGSSNIEALLDVGNMLAEGYRPYVLSDGSVLIFAQNQRSVRAGLAFTF